MKPLRTLIVDDEPIARKILREELETFDGVTLIAEVSDGVAALKAIEEEAPDLVFLDLEMPAMGGLEVVAQLKSERRMPCIVIVTAWDQHAIRAFDAGAVDYLLKPVARERLADAVERATRMTGREAAERVASLQEIADQKPETPARKIVGKSGGEYILLNAREVFAFEAEGDLVWIVTARSKYLATQTLRALEQKLESAGFRRIHRGALVNLEHVRKLSTLSSQRWLLTLANNMEFIVSKRQARNIRHLLNC